MSASSLPPETRRFIRFCVVGGSGVLVNMAIFSVVRLALGDMSEMARENAAVVTGFAVSCLTNFLINDRDYVVPMVVEEPSVVAAASNSTSPSILLAYGANDCHARAATLELARVWAMLVPRGSSNRRPGSDKACVRHMRAANSATPERGMRRKQRARARG